MPLSSAMALDARSSSSIQAIEIDFRGQRVRNKGLLAVHRWDQLAAGRAFEIRNFHVVRSMPEEPLNYTFCHQSTIRRGELYRGTASHYPPHCARWRSRWSASVSATIASATGTARMATQGSCRPFGRDLRVLAAG